MSKEFNMNQIERIVSAVAGSALVSYGLAKRSGVSSLLSIASGLPLVWRGTTGNCPIYNALGIDTSEDASFQSTPAKAPSAPSMPVPSHVSAQTETGVTSGKPIHVEHTIVVNKPLADVFRFWSNFENLPQFMDYLESVKLFPNGTTRWKAKAPLGTNIEWDAEIADAVPNEMIAWRSLARSSVQNEGKVEFKATDDENTEVKVTLDYRPPAGAVGAAIAKLFGTDPTKTIAEDMQKFKEVIESDAPVEVAKAVASPTQTTDDSSDLHEQLKKEAKINKEESLDDAEKAVDQSFPASDPPANW